jgi:hypothetical protein
VALALAAGVASAVYYPSIRAAIPSIVEAGELPHANALSQTVGNAGLAAGPLAAGLLISASGVDLAYALNAASFVVSGALLARLPANGRPSTAVRERDHWHAVTEGLRVFTGSAALRMVLSIWTLASLGGAAINVGEVFIAKQTFHAGTFGFCLLASASGAGLVAGSALAPRLLNGAPGRVCRLGVAVEAAGFAAAALAPNIWVAAGCELVGTIGSAVLLAAATLLVQREAGEAQLGHAFAIFDGAGFIAIGLGMFAAGIAMGALGAQGTWLAAAGLLALAALTSVSRRQAVEIARPEPGLS